MVRVKYRYVLVEVACADYLQHFQKVKLSILPFQIYKCVEDAIKSMLGDYGCGILKNGLHVVAFNPYTRIACVRVKRDAHKLLSMILPFVNKIGNSRGFFRTLHVSGTLRSADKFLQRYYFRHLASLLKNCKTDDERREVQDSIRSCLVPTDKSALKYASSGVKLE